MSVHTHTHAHTHTHIRTHTHTHTHAQTHANGEIERMNEQRKTFLLETDMGQVGEKGRGADRRRRRKPKKKTNLARAFDLTSTLCQQAVWSYSVISGSTFDDDPLPPPPPPPPTTSNSGRGGGRGGVRGGGRERMEEKPRSGLSRCSLTLLTLFCIISLLLLGLNAF